MATEKLEIIISLKDKLTRGLRLVGKSLGAVRAGLDKVKGAVFSLQSAFIAFGAGMIARGFLIVAMAFEKFETVLKTITGSAAKAKESMEWITEFTAKTPYELAGVTDAFVKLVSYGFDPTIKILKVLGDTAAGMAKPLIMAVEMFADAATGEFERLKEFGIRAKQQGDRVTFSWVENGKQMVKTAKKTQAGITTALIDIFEKKYAGAMDNLSKTVGGMWSNMQDQFTLFQKAVMDAGVFDYIKNSLTIILNRVDKLREEGKLDEWAKEIAAKVIRSFEHMVLGVASVYDVFVPIMKNFKKAFSAIWDWFKQLPTWVQTAGLALAIVGGKNVKLTLVVLAMTAESVKDLAKLFKAMASSVSETSPEIEKLRHDLALLEIAKEAAGKWSPFGDPKEQKEKVKKIEEQILLVQNRISQLTPIKIVTDEEENKIESMRAKAEKLIAFLREAAEEVAIEEDKAPPPPPELPAKPRLDLISQVKEDLIALEVLYQKGEKELIAYLERRKVLVLQMLELEIKKLEEAAKVETDPGKRLKIEHSIFMKKQEYALKEIELVGKIAEAHADAAERKVEVEEMFKDLRDRTRDEIDSEQAADLAKMDERHAEELALFKEALNNKLAAELGYIDEADALREVSRQQQLEKDKLLEEQQRALWEKRLTFASEAAGYLKNIFQDLYELGGEQSKKMFKLMKSAAIAESLINTYKAVTGALGTPPYGLAAIATATLIALKGGIEVAKIKAQEMAGGGLVEGHSPHNKADNINIKGTAGEFMQPIPAVKYYGKKVMEGIRQRAFPKGLFEGFSLPALAYAKPSHSLALGGPVAGSRGSDFSVSVPININSDRAVGIAGVLQEEVEQTVIRVMERELR